jgi:hypothetical protein
MIGLIVIMVGSIAFVVGLVVGKLPPKPTFREVRELPRAITHASRDRQADIRAVLRGRR